MNKKEFEKLKIGDKVQIVSKKEPFDCRWNSDGLMDKWLGKVMTIRRICWGHADMNEDIGERTVRSNGWYWFPEMIEKKIEDNTEDNPTIVEHLIKGNKTIVKLSNGKVGVAACSPEDIFDPYEGFRLAAARAYGKEPAFKKPSDKQKVKEVKRQAKAGEFIKIVDPDPLFDKHAYQVGDIMQVISTDRNEVHAKHISSEYGLSYSIWHTEYVVLKGYKPEDK